MTIRVTPDQVDNARLLMALDKARGRASEAWIVRLANAVPAPATKGLPPTGRPTERPTDAAGD